MNLSSTTTGNKTKYKLVFLGDQSVGKSSIIEKYIHGKFDEASNPTVGIDFLAKNLTHKQRNYRLQLWDTAGQERFRSLIPSYLKDAISSLIIYDVTSKQSLVNAERWLKLYNDNKVTDGYSILVGNKIDLSYRVVRSEQGKAVADSLKIDYFEISAKTGQHVEELFLHIIDQLIQGKTNGTGNVLDAFKEQIKQQKEDDRDDGRDQQRHVRKSRLDNYSSPVDQTNYTLNVNNTGYVPSKNISSSQPYIIPQYYPNGIPQQSMPSVVVYTQAPGSQTPVSANIVLSNVQPPPIQEKNNKCCSG